MSESLFWALLLVHLAATWYMVGLIWFVQMVHYPLLAWVGESASVAYQREHMRRTTWVVLPPMVVEAFSALILVLNGPLGWANWMGVVGVGLLGVTWGSTFLIQVPCHEKLAQGFQREMHARLVRTNWFRTLAWSVRGLLALGMVWA